jgi:alpha-D-xyloside xylohydrolase
MVSKVNGKLKGTITPALNGKPDNVGNVTFKAMTEL